MASPRDRLRESWDEVSGTLSAVGGMLALAERQGEADDQGVHTERVCCTTGLASSQVLDPSARLKMRLCSCRRGVISR